MSDIKKNYGDCSFFSYFFLVGYSYLEECDEVCGLEECQR